MARNCSACQELREVSPEFVTNGVTENVCTSLKNDTGLNPSLEVLRNDEDDLNLVADCLIGNMEGEIEAYDVCDWKDYMRKFVPNVYNTIKAMLCAIFGIWHKVNCILTSINNFDNEYRYSNEITYQAGFTNVNTASNPRRFPTVTYSAFTAYDLIKPTAEMAATLNAVPVGADYAEAQYGGPHYIDDVQVNGFPVFTFTGNIHDANIVDLYPQVFTDTSGTCTYGVYPVPWNGVNLDDSADAEGNVKFYLAIRTRLDTFSPNKNLSFSWLMGVRRRLNFDC